MADTTAALKDRIGQTGSMRIGTLSFDITILDAKTAYGNVRYLVQPVAGQGQCWTENVLLPSLR